MSGGAGNRTPPRGRLPEASQIIGSTIPGLYAVGRVNGDREPASDGSKGVGPVGEREVLKYALDALDGGDLDVVRSILRGLSAPEVTS